MVSTSRTKSCKILFCLGEIVLFYFFASGNHYLNYVEAIFFKKKAPLLLIETVFSEKTDFFICQIFLVVKTVFPSSGNVFLNEFFISAGGNGFSV